MINMKIILLKKIIVKIELKEHDYIIAPKIRVSVLKTVVKDADHYASTCDAHSPHRQYVQIVAYDTPGLTSINLVNKIK